MTGTDLNEFTGEWDYSTLPRNVQLGEGCFIERKESFARFRTKRQPGLVLGLRVRIYTWTAFSLEEDALVEIGDETILVGAVLMCAQRITIGRRVIVSYNVTIADSDFHPVDPEARKLDAIANAPFGDRSHRPQFQSRPVIIGDDARIGIGAIILKGVVIGHGARVGAGAVVTREVPPGATVVGNPARIVEANP
jgi:acetyltransferase-like isoleucine patch superfamily enzyme